MRMFTKINDSDYVRVLNYDCSFYGLFSKIASRTRCIPGPNSELLLQNSGSVGYLCDTTVCSHAN